MGGGEYNNLGHYVYLKNEDGTYDEIGELPVMPELPTGGVVDNSESLSMEQRGFEIKLKEGTFNVRVLEKMGVFIRPNNYRKMHGKPMRRKVRR